MLLPRSPKLLCVPIRKVSFAYSQASPASGPVGTTFKIVIDYEITKATGMGDVALISTSEEILFSF